MCGPGITLSCGRKFGEVVQKRTRRYLTSLHPAFNPEHDTTCVRVLREVGDRIAEFIIHT